MKAKSNDFPARIAVERFDGVADVVLCENIELIDEDGVGVYTYDTYRITVADRIGIEDSVEQDFDAWVETAKKSDHPERIKKLKEDLANTDYKIIKCSEYQLAGMELPYDIAQLHADRQALRDEIRLLG